MYKCESCKRTIGANTRSYKVVQETRNAEYPRRVKRDGDGKVVKVLDEGGSGIEIVKEITVCPKCFEAQSDV